MPLVMATSIFDIGKKHLEFSSVVLLIPSQIHILHANIQHRNIIDHMTADQLIDTLNMVQLTDFSNLHLAVY